MHFKQILNQDQNKAKWSYIGKITTKDESLLISKLQCVFIPGRVCNKCVNVCNRLQRHVVLTAMWFCPKNIWARRELWAESGATECGPCKSDIYIWKTYSFLCLILVLCHMKKSSIHQRKNSTKSANSTLHSATAASSLHTHKMFSP